MGILFTGVALVALNLASLRFAVDTRESGDWHTVSSNLR